MSWQITTPPLEDGKMRRSIASPPSIVSRGSVRVPGELMSVELNAVLSLATHVHVEEGVDEEHSLITPHFRLRQQQRRVVPEEQVGFIPIQEYEPSVEVQPTGGGRDLEGGFYGHHGSPTPTRRVTLSSPAARSFDYFTNSASCAYHLLLPPISAAPDSHSGAASPHGVEAANLMQPVGWTAYASYSPPYSNVEAYIGLQTQTWAGYSSVPAHVFNANDDPHYGNHAYGHHLANGLDPQAPYQWLYQPGVYLQDAEDLQFYDEEMTRTSAFPSSLQGYYSHDSFPGGSTTRPSSPADDDSPLGDYSTRPPRGKELFVYHLPFEMTNGELRDIFSQHGTVTRTTIARHASGASQGYAFVKFKKQDAADDALLRLNHYEVSKKT